MRGLSPLDPRIPDWDLSSLAPRACPLCGIAGEPRFRRPDRLTVELCPSCQLWFVSPAPRPEALDDFYRDYDQTHRREARLPDDVLLHHLRSLDPAHDPHLDLLRQVIGDLRGRDVLDVGFGRGVLLARLAALGAKPSGVELDASRVRFVREQLGLPAIHGTVADLAPEPAYDLITLVDLVEHPLDPLELLRNCVSRLRPGGSLYLLTPNGTHLEDHEDPVTLRVDLEHMQYFTRASMAAVGGTLGLEVVHLDEWGHPELAGFDRPAPPPAIWRARLTRLLHGLPGGGRLQARRTARRSAIAQAEAAHNASGRYHLRAILRKP